MDFLGNGLGPDRIGADFSSSLIAFPMETYQSPPLDLTTATLGIELVPAKPSHAPRMSIGRWIIESASGTQVTPLSFRAGADAARTNFVPLTSTNPANVDVNSADPPSAGGLIPVTFGVQIFPNTPIYLDVVSGAQGTGGFALRGRFHVFVMWGSV